MEDVAIEMQLLSRDRSRRNSAKEGLRLCEAARMRCERFVPSKRNDVSGADRRLLAEDEGHSRTTTPTVIPRFHRRLRLPLSLSSTDTHLPTYFFHRFSSRPHLEASVPSNFIRPTYRLLIDGQKVCQILRPFPYPFAATSRQANPLDLSEIFLERRAYFASLPPRKNFRSPRTKKCRAGWLIVFDLLRATVKEAVRESVDVFGQGFSFIEENDGERV